MKKGGGRDKRRRFQTAVPEEKSGPISRILNHTWPEPSKFTAAPGAFAMYLLEVNLNSVMIILRGIHALRAVRRDIQLHLR